VLLLHPLPEPPALRGLQALPNEAPEEAGAVHPRQELPARLQARVLCLEPVQHVVHELVAHVSEGVEVPRRGKDGAQRVLTHLGGGDKSNVGPGGAEDDDEDGERKQGSHAGVWAGRRSDTHHSTTM